MSTLNVLRIGVASRVDQVVDALADLIGSRSIQAGEFLPSELELCRQMEVSRTTIRQAIRTLEARGLVVAQHGVGVRVSDRTREVAVDAIERMLSYRRAPTYDALEVRRMLECQGAALAAERRTEDDITRMSIPIAQMRRDDLSVEEYVQEDLGFHLAVAQASKNDLLVALVLTLRGLLLSTISAGFAVDLDLNIRLRAHQDILDAISQRDSLAAEVAMRDHLANLEQSIQAE